MYNMMQRSRNFLGSAAARHAIYGISAKKTREAISRAAGERFKESGVVTRQTAARLSELTPEEIKPLMVEALGGADVLGALTELAVELQRDTVAIGDLGGGPLTGRMGRQPLLHRDRVVEEARRNEVFLQKLGQVIQQLSDRRVFSLISAHVAEHDPQEVLELPLHELAFIFEPYTGRSSMECDGLGVAC